MTDAKPDPLEELKRSREMAHTCLEYIGQPCYRCGVDDAAIAAWEKERHDAGDCINEYDALLREYDALRAAVEKVRDDMPDPGWRAMLDAALGAKP